MTMLLGGRTAEEIVFGEPTTGASDDIERCTDIARKMVTTYGMSDRLGPQQLSGASGREGAAASTGGGESAYSDEVAGMIDREVRRLVDGAHDRARHILETHRATLDRLADALVEKETLDDSDLAEVFGPIDKGAGIEMPERRRDDEPYDGDFVGGGRLLGAPSMNISSVQVAVPAPSWRQRFARTFRRSWLGARAPRPTT